MNGNPIDIYTYSKTDLITSEQLLASMSDMLKAAGEFIIEFPVDRYTFLYHFEDEGWGAWEHSYSSEYVMDEQEYVGEFKNDEPTFAILKHNNACGIATRKTMKTAYLDALAGDPTSAFGGVLIANGNIDLATAEEINKLFYRNHQYHHLHFLLWD